MRRAWARAWPRARARARVRVEPLRVLGRREGALDDDRLGRLVTPLRGGTRG